MPDLTPSQRRRLDRVRSDAFEALRRERRNLLLELREQGWSLRDMAKEMGVKHPLIVRWMREE